MPKIIDLTGKQFGRLTVKKESGRDKWGNKMYLCLCSCGNEKVVAGRNLVTGTTSSCGCKAKENYIFHGLSYLNDKTKRLYNVWWNMKERCYNKNSISYKYYGGRGIKVYSTWREDFITFYLWAVTNGYKEGLQLDRIDNDGNYYPGNCKFSTREEQARNRQNSIFVTYKGEEIPLAELAEIKNVKYETLRQQYHKGMI